MTKEFKDNAHGEAEVTLSWTPQDSDLFRFVPVCFAAETSERWVFVWTSTVQISFSLLFLWTCWSYRHGMAKKQAMTYWWIIIVIIILRSIVLPLLPYACLHSTSHLCFFIQPIRDEVCHCCGEPIIYDPRFVIISYHCWNHYRLYHRCISRLVLHAVGLQHQPFVQSINCNLEN